MPQARLTVRLSDGARSGRVSRAYSDARFREPSALVEAGAGVAEPSTLGQSSGRAVLQPGTATLGPLRFARAAGAPVAVEGA